MFSAFLLFVLVTFAWSAESPSVEMLPEYGGWINWERQIIKAVGHGVLPGDVENPSQAMLMARSAAIADAYRNLAMMTNGVRVTSDTYVKNFVTQSDEIHTKVQALIQGAEIVSEKQLADRSFEVIVQLPMAGKQSLMKELAPQLLDEAKSPPPSQEGSCTGLIIDARGLDVKPAMSPKVYDQDGNEVYGTVNVSPDYAIESGIAAYPQDMAQALKSPRAGKNPLVVKAVSKGPKFSCDIILNNTDAEKMRAAEKESGVLSRCRVSIVIGPVEVR